MLRIGLVTSTLLLIVSANHVSMAFLQPSRCHKTTPSCVCSNYKFGIHTNQVSVLKTQFHKKTLVSFSILVVDGDKKKRLRRMNELLNRLQAWILMLVRKQMFYNACIIFRLNIQICVQTVVDLITNRVALVVL